MQSFDPRWEHMNAKVRRSPMQTTFSVLVRHKGRVNSQVVIVANWRLDRYPVLYKRTLDWMVRDIDARLPALP
jgi:hypothetical protein